MFDDVLWVENAKDYHFDFGAKIRDRGVEVVEPHSLLAETPMIYRRRYLPAAWRHGLDLKFFLNYLLFWFSM